MKIRVLLFVLATSVLMAGCAGSGSSVPVITEETLLNIHAGQSTRDDVTKLLGSPERIFNFSRLNEEVWDYSYARGTWLMILNVHFDSRSGKVTSYFSQPDPKIYQPNDHGS